jgi:hypothetical protein
MLRVPQHERKNINDINAPPFVLSSSKDSERFFSKLLGRSRSSAPKTI